MRYVTVGTHTAGALIAQIVLDRDDQVLGSEGQYSGYPAGITVAN
jgi:aspartate/methionine/tyrosine aminotransferase